MTMVTYTRTTATVIVETVNIAAPHHHTAPPQKK